MRISVLLLGVIATAGLLVSSIWIDAQRDAITVGPLAFERLELQVNDFEASQQDRVAVAVDESGQTIAVWHSRRQQEGTYGVYSRAIHADGRLSASERQVNAGRAGMQRSPAVAVADEACHIGWTATPGDAHGSGVQIRFDHGDESIASGTTAGDQTGLALAALADGTVVATWVSAGPEGARDQVLYRLFTADGRPLTSELTVVEDARARRSSATIAASDMRFMIAWTEASLDGSSLDVRARVFDAGGAPSTPPLAVDQTDADAIEPALAGDGRGKFVVAWMQLHPVSDYDVCVRRLDADARWLAPPVIASADREGWQNGAAVACLPGGGWVVAWNDVTDDGHGSRILARLFDVDGTAMSSDVPVNGHSTSFQRLAPASSAQRIAAGADGRLAFAWEGDGGSGDRSAAHVTLWIPADSAPGLLATAGRLLHHARLARGGSPDAADDGLAAVPYQPPAFDPATAASPPEQVDIVDLGGGDIGFDGIFATGWTPPDPHMAVGPDHVVLMTNGAIRVAAKDGTIAWQLDINGGGGFWGAQGAGSFLFDPEVLFDTLSGRYIAMANERQGSRSYFLIAVSETGDASDPDAWYKYRLNVTPIAGNDIDSPNMAVDGDYIYLTADFFGPDRYLIYTVLKSSVLNGGTPATSSFLRTGTHSIGLPSMYTTDAPRMYMIEHFDAEPSSTLRLWAIHDPGGAISLESAMLDVPTYYRPGSSRSRGTSTQVILFESRFWSCMYRDGSLWACHHISESNSPRYSVARWYEIEMNGWPTSGQTPTLRQSGTVDAGANIYLTFNSIFADAAGNAVMTFARSSTDEYYSISRTARLMGDPLGTMGPPAFVKESGVTYGDNRWGDYSAVVADPAQLGKFWLHHEYAISSFVWRTWVACETIMETAGLDVAADAPAPSYLRLGPTPTRGAVSFEIGTAAAGQLRVYDVQGRLVRTWDRAGVVDAGRLTWDGRDAHGLSVPNGVYFVELTVGGAPVARERLVISR